MLDIFEILGPVMIGPSSSHTAGAAKIGAMARTLLGAPPVKAAIHLYGSFAETGAGHGTDRALVGGLLGMKPDDPRLPDAFAEAEKAGLTYTIDEIKLRDAHPNTAVIEAKSADGRTLTMQASSIGGGMMVIKGNGGEGKSQIGAVLSTIFGTNMKDGSIGKISENRFARADLEHILLCVDDDMRMEALRQTNYVKSIVTAQGKMDLERKGKQSYQGWMFARLLAFSNGDLQALYDRSDGFYRRQLVLTTKEKQVDRADDPDLAEKMKAEAEGIFLWAFEGLQRLVANNFKFTESDRIRENREAVKRDNNNIFDFMESEGYIRRKADASISSKDFYEIYRMWCEENSLAPLKARSFSDAMIANARKFNLEHCNNITNSAGRRVWGFMGVEAIARPHINGFYGDSPCTYVPEDIPEEWRQVE